ncbi:MAG: hypothetical protein ACW96M_03435, partial [Candidatus Thorarchaeota archaeon]
IASSDAVSVSIKKCLMKVSYQFCNYKNHKTFSELRKDFDVQEFVGEPPSFDVFFIFQLTHPVKSD